jgi:hypothetical protein
MPVVQRVDGREGATAVGARRRHNTRPAVVERHAPTHSFLFGPTVAARDDGVELRACPQPV